MAGRLIGFTVVQYVVTVVCDRFRWYLFATDAFGIMWYIESCKIRWIVSMHRAELGEAAKNFGFVVKL